MSNIYNRDIGFSNTRSDEGSSLVFNKGDNLQKKRIQTKNRKIKNVKPKKNELVSFKKTTSLTCVEYWTRNKLVDELVYQLSSINSCVIDRFTKQIIFAHKYLDQTEEIIYRINLWEPVPKFNINKLDLTDKLKEKIADTCPGPADLDIVLTETVRRILEAVNPRYFHLSGIYGKVRWRLES